MSPTSPSSDGLFVDLSCYFVDEVMLVGQPYRTEISAYAQPSSPTGANMKFKTWLRSTETAVWDHSGYIDRTDDAADEARQSITVRNLSADTMTGENSRGRIQRKLPIDTFKILYQRLCASTSLGTFENDDSEQEPSGRSRLTAYVEAHRRAVRDMLLHRNAAYPFRTVTGYSCLSTEGPCAVGDSIVISPGLSVPLLVRKNIVANNHNLPPRGTTYSLVGAAYLHGVMNGEF